MGMAVGWRGRMVGFEQGCSEADSGVVVDVLVLTGLAMKSDFLHWVMRRTSAKTSSAGMRIATPRSISHWTC